MLTSSLDSLGKPLPYLAALVGSKLSHRRGCPRFCFISMVRAHAAKSL